MIEVAAGLMLARKNEEAIICICEELKKVHTFMRNADGCDVPSPSSTASACSSGYVTCQLPELPRSEAALSPDGTFELFNRAFVLSTVPGDAQQVCDVVTTVLLYNMALTYQRSGIEQQRSQCLLKALQLYQMAEASIWTFAKAKKTSFALLLLTAVTNNMGFLHSTLFDIRQARECRLNVVSYLESAAQEEYDLGEEDYSFFVLNEFFLQETTVGAPMA